MKTYGYKRSDRVGDQLRAEIADILTRKIKDPSVGFVTVTAVEVTGDLRQAKVFVSFMNEGPEVEETLQVLLNASGFIRSELGKRLNLKYLPRLLFRQDLSGERADHISQLLDEIKEREGEPPL